MVLAISLYILNILLFQCDKVQADIFCPFCLSIFSVDSSNNRYTWYRWLIKRSIMEILPQRLFELNFTKEILFIKNCVLSIYTKWKCNKPITYFMIASYPIIISELEATSIVFAFSETAAQIENDWELPK